MNRKGPYITAACALLFCLLASCSAENTNNADAVSDDQEIDAAGAKKGAKGARIPNIRAEEELLEKAVDAYDRELFTLAKDTFNQLLETYPSSYFAPFAQLKAADALFFLKDYPAAVGAYQEFNKLYPKHEAAVYAQFQIGNAHRLQYRGPKHDQMPLISAVKAYQEALKEHPNSQFSAQARRDVEDCREKLAQHEELVARFYLKQGQREASANRAREMSDKYADVPAAQEARSTIEGQLANDPQLLDFIRTGKGVRPIGEKARVLAPRAPHVIHAGRPAARRSDSRSAAVQKHTAESSALESSSGSTPAVQGEANEAEPVKDRMLTDVNCGHLGEHGIMSARFPRAVRIVSQTEERANDSSARTVRVLVAYNGESAVDLAQLSLVTIGAERTCDINGVRLLVQELQPANAGDQRGRRFVLVHALLPEQRSIEFMTLDRPYRLVGILEGSASQRRK